MAQQNLRRSSSGVNLPAAVSNEIWAAAAEASAVTQVARQIPLPGSGVSVPMITGEPTANWVDETEEKPVSNGTVDNKTITPYKLAVIETFSNEFRRDLPGLYNALVQRLPGAIAKKFDQTVYGYAAAPGSNFDTLASAPTSSINTAGSVYSGLLSAVGTVANTGLGDVSAFVMSTQGELKMLGELDANDRPLFAGANDAVGSGGTSIGSLLGRPVVRSRYVYKADTTGTAGGVNAETLGFAGDWQDGAVWGQVTGINIKISDQATLTVAGNPINLWQRNMFAVLAEVEMGFRVKDVNRFVRLVGADLGT